MASRVVVQKKKTGRPSKGAGSVSAIRLSDDLRAAIDKWAAKQEDLPSRSEAIRRLLEISLGAAAEDAADVATYDRRKKALKRK